jgi:methylated-DNA-protein-cysteine methyltransferase-like protein
LKALPAQSKKKEKRLSKYNSQTVPWHRVINSLGGTSTHKIADIPPGLQRRMLEAEGLVFDEEEKVDLPKYLWVEGMKEMARH